MKKQQLIFFAVFAGLSILTSSVRFTPLLVGQNLKFTFFDLYAPIAGGLFGSGIGAITVFAIELYNLIFRQTFSLAGILHLFPVMFGAWYFGTNRKSINIIPSLAIVGFLATPVGREVWYYTLFWLIPIICQLFKEKSMAARALGATFTTHAVGGALWSFAFHPPAAVWDSLIPIVMVERLVFAATSVIMYLILKRTYEIYSRQNQETPAAER